MSVENIGSSVRNVHTPAQVPNNKSFITEIFENAITSLQGRFLSIIPYRWVFRYVPITLDMVVVSFLFMSVFLSFGYMIAIQTGFAYTLCRYIKIRNLNSNLQSKVNQLSFYRDVADELRQNNQKLTTDLEMSSLTIGQLQWETERLKARGVESEEALKTARADRDFIALNRAPLIQERDHWKREAEKMEQLATFLKSQVTELTRDRDQALQSKEELSAANAQLLERLSAVKVREPRSSSDNLEEFFGAINDYLKEQSSSELIPGFYRLLEMNQSDRQSIHKRLEARLVKTDGQSKLDLQEILDIVDAEISLAERFGTILKGLNCFYYDLSSDKPSTNCRREVSYV